MVKCNKCGKPLRTLEINCFMCDGNDRYENSQLHVLENESVYAEVPLSWTGYGVSDDEKRGSIRCPHCHRFPFDDGEIQTYPHIRVVMFDNKKHPGEEDIPVDWVWEAIQENPGYADSWMDLLALWKKKSEEN